MAFFIIGEMILNDAGQIAKITTVGANKYSPNNYPIKNKSSHSLNRAKHTMVEDRAKDFSPLRGSPSKTIGSMVRGFKIGVTKWIRQNSDIHNVWQRNYYEHIIRNEDEYHHITQYITENPAKWNDDKLNPEKNK